MDSGIAIHKRAAALVFLVLELLARHQFFGGIPGVRVTPCGSKEALLALHHQSLWLDRSQTHFGQIDIQLAIGEMHKHKHKHNEAKRLSV